MAFHLVQRLARRRIPQAHDAVVRRDHDVIRVWGRCAGEFEFRPRARAQGRKRPATGDPWQFQGP